MNSTRRVRHVVLTGPMGAGKTSTGKLLAKRLGRPFADVDGEIVKQHGPIGHIFSEHGEPTFRRIEARTLAALLAQPPSVISLGGGTILSAQSRKRLAREFVIFLDVSREAVVRRLAGEDRPLLKHDIANWGMADWIFIYDNRRALYDTVSGVRIDTSQRSVEQVVDAILAELPVAVAQPPLPERAVTGSAELLPMTAHQFAAPWARRERDLRQLELIALLRRAASVTTEGSDALLAEHGLNRGQFDILAALHRHDGPVMTQAELAEQMQVTPAGIQKRLAGLFGGGLVERLPAEDDGRKYLLGLTGDGRAHLEQIMDGFISSEGAALARLDSADQRQLIALLRLLLGIG